MQVSHCRILRVVIARCLSILFHPFVMVGVMVATAAAARQTPGQALVSVVLVALFTIVPLALLMFRQVRRGAWGNADASNRSERPILYIAGGLSLAALLGYLLLAQSQSFMIRGTVVTLAMVAACALATRWIKVSLHMAFATMAATALSLMRSPVGYALVVVLPALAWSRLTLERHTPHEMALGAVIGAAAGAATHFL
jgi:hypothetical protein